MFVSLYAAGHMCVDVPVTSIKRSVVVHLLVATLPLLPAPEVCFPPPLYLIKLC